MVKTIFITGASTGLGKASALLFAQRGWNVIATMRNPGSAPELAGVSGVTVLALDVTDPAAIQKVAAKVLATHKVDVVLNNAGYGQAGPFEGTSDDALRRQIDTNLLGVLRVTQAFVPHFRENKSGTFIAITSIGGHVAFPFNSVYHATKWGLEGWNESLAYELAPFGIRAKTVAPGGIRTDFAGRSLSLAKHPAYDALVAKTMAGFGKGGGSSAEQIAEVVYQAATDGTDQVHYVAGKDAQALVKARKWLGTKRFIKMIRKRFLGM
jgi:NAD(P)-dependent dehydrogenase (short-subunit alcohol dehydrogenase family)